MKKILYIQDHLGLGGITTVSASKQKYLVEHGYKVVNLFTHYTPAPDILSKYDERIKAVGIPLKRRERFLSVPVLGRIVWYIYFRVLFIVHILRYNPKFIVSTHQNLEPLTVVAATFWKRRFLEFHISGVDIAKSTIDRIRFKFKLRFYTLVSLTNGDAEDKYSALSQKTIVISNPVSCSDEYVSTCMSRKVIIPARFSPQKGLAQFLPYWKQIEEKHPDWELHLWGDGEEKEALIALKEKYALSTVFFNGYTNEVIKKIADCSIMLLPSMYEGFPTTLVEAMTCGVPCVAFDCKYGPRDIICDGEDGCLVEFKNYEQFIEKIDMLISNDSLRKAMGEKARKNIRRYRLENVMPKWEEVFDK